MKTTLRYRWCGLLLALRVVWVAGLCASLLSAEIKDSQRSTNLAPVSRDLDAKITGLAKRGTTVADAIRLLGEPKQYVWGKETFSKNNLPERYILQYPDGLQVVVYGGAVSEVRCELPGPGFTWRGKLRLGSSVEEVLQAVGPPSETVVGKPCAYAPGVLYRDIDGKKGSCYYGRPEQNVRMFFMDDKVCALYLPCEDGDAGESYMTIKPLKEVKEYQDVRFKDLTGIDLSTKPELPATFWFNRKTVWPESMPAVGDPAKLLAGAMNPGLGVRKLHEQGLTGKGVSVAIIDQPLFRDHPEFAGKIAAYHDMGCKSEKSMHGPAVASLLVGTQCGTAPDARVYFVAAPSWTADSEFQAKALDWIVEQNAKLPPIEKIRVVSVSAAPSGLGSPFKKNNDMWDPACERAEKAGILVLDCTSHHGFIGPCYYDAADPENVGKVKPGFPSRPFSSANIEPHLRDCLLVPCSPRATAEEYNAGEHEYQYCGQGGLSWSIPYCAGVLAMGWQARPDLSGPQMRELLFASAFVTPGGLKIIQPTAFLDAVRGK